MGCLECGSEQAVPDAGTCERCGAPPAGAWHPPEAITGPRGAELRLDSSGLTYSPRA